MSEYQVIARKWRPQKFSDVIGQEHITKTLKNEIVQNRTAHAYLFVGPRGIGKTTSARIFAKAMNCTNSQDGEPCCKCPSCVSIAEGSNIDVIEIDAASQNSVQNIRDLCEEVMFAPVKSKYKIYIVDEVHMLSDKAWNAFLKTVEEPPAHAKFIFATTEAHKVLATITSRCQRFDLRRIPTRLISERLKLICQTEKCNISPAAIAAIARAADGGMRDAQSLLDQMISFFSAHDNGEISEEQVLSLFGLTSITEIQTLLKAILLNDKATLINSIHNLALKGKNLETLFEEILQFLRGIQLCRIIPNPENVLEESDETIGLYKNLAALASVDRIQRLMENLAPVGRMLHDAINKQVCLETIILKAMRIAHAVQIEDLIARLNQIRKNEDLVLPDSGAAPALPVTEIHRQQTAELPNQMAKASVTQVPPPLEPPHKIQSDETQAHQQQAETPVKSLTPAIETQSRPIHTEAAETNSAENTRAEEDDDESVEDPQETAASVQPPEENISEEEEIPPEPVEEAENISPISADKPHTETEEPEQTHTAETAASYSNPLRKDAPAKPAKTLDEIWCMLIQELEKDPARLTLLQYLKEAIPESFINSILTLVFDEEFEKEHLIAVKKELPFLTKRLQAISGNKTASFLIKLNEGPHEMRRSNTEKLNEAKEHVKNNKFVKEVMDLFDGVIVDVHHG